MDRMEMLPMHPMHPMHPESGPGFIVSVDTVASLRKAAPAALIYNSPSWRQMSWLELEPTLPEYIGTQWSKKT